MHKWYGTQKYTPYQIDNKYTDQFDAFGFSPYSRIYNYPAGSWGAGLLFDEYMAKQPWSGHPYRPFASALFQYCVFETDSIQGAVWAPVNCWGVKLGVVCVKDPIED